ncbi:MAG: sensor histidine kinase [Lachnospirales bacterium]
MKKQQPLRKQILYLAFFLGISLILLTVFSIFSYSRLLNSTVKSNQEDYSSQVLYATEKNLDNLKNIASSIAYNKIIQKYLIEDDPEKKFTLYQQVINLLNNTKLLNNSILDIAIIGQNETFANVMGDFSLYNSIEKDSQLKFSDRKKLIVDGTPYPCQILSMPVYNLATIDSRYIGTLNITINISTLLGDAYIDDNFMPVELLFINTNNSLIFGNNNLYKAMKHTDPSSKEFSIIYNSQTYNGQKFYVKASNSYLYTLINQSIYTKKIISMVKKQFIILLFTLTLISMVFYRNMKKISNAFYELTNIMDKVTTRKRNALKERISIDTSRQLCLEAYNIATSYNHMMDEIDRLNRDIFTTYNKMYEMELNERRSEIAFLRSQINPHFLYNTLTLICGMATENHKDGIISITSALANIYRYSIENEVVALYHEIDVIKSYIEIQKTRFENRFDVVYNISPDIYNAVIPRMIIQPLVENAVQHGIEKSLKKSTLTIGGKKNKNNLLVIWVEDTGVGMTDDRLKYVLNLINGTDFSNKKTNQETNIGLYNVNRRITLYYGEEYKLHIYSKANEKTKIEFKIPYKESI